MLYFLSMELLMPKKKKQTRTSTAVTRGLWWHRQERLRGNSLAHQGTCGEEEWSGSTPSPGKCLVPSFFFWRRRPLGIKLSNGSFSKCFWRQPGAAIQLSSIKGEERRRNLYILIPWWMEELAARLGELIRNRLKTWAWSSAQKWAPRPPETVWAPLCWGLN